MFLKIFQVSTDEEMGKQSKLVEFFNSKPFSNSCLRDWRAQRGLATAFDLAAFWLSMITPVKKSVNHSRTVASMRETGWEKQQEAHLRSDSTV